MRSRSAALALRRRFRDHSSIRSQTYGLVFLGHALEGFDQIAKGFFVVGRPSDQEVQSLSAEVVHPRARDDLPGPEASLRQRGR